MLARRVSLCLSAALTAWLLGLNGANAAQVAYWNFDTNFNATVGGPTYDATPTNGASISGVQSKWGGGAAHFDKVSSQYATTTASPFGTGSFSYSLWYYLDVEATGPTPDRQFSSFGTGGPGDAYTVHFNIDGSTSLPPGNNDDILVFHSLTATGLAAGIVPEIVYPLPNPFDHRAWRNAIGTVTYDSVADTTTLEAFWDGVSVGTSSAPGSPMPTTFVAFGVDRYLADRLWEGYVDDVAVYDHVLTAGEIAALQTGPAVGGPVDPPTSNGRATLWQLPLVFHGNSYVIQSPTGRIAVFDGGSDEGGSGIFGGNGPAVDRTYLTNFLHSLGGHVDDWFISHPHTDHVSVLTDILNSPDLDGLTIDNIYAQLPNESWLEVYEPVNMLPAERAFKAALAARGKSVIRPTAGDQIDLDGLKFQVLSEIDESSGINDPNDFSMVVKLTTPNTSVLFLGDIGPAGGDLLLAGEFRDQLPSDYVQMAHHGNWAVGREFYEEVAAKYALWPAQSWLYDAPPDNQWGYDSWQVRQWMEELGVLENYVMKDGLAEIDLGVVPDPNTMEGDYNGNGTVDATDYTVWRDTLGASVTAGQGADGNSNGTIDAGDYDFWRARFGNTVPGSGSSAVVPEPATVNLALLAISLGLIRLRIKVWDNELHGQRRVIREIVSEIHSANHQTKGW